MGRESDFLKSLISTNSPIMMEVGLIDALHSDQVMVRKAIQILDGWMIAAVSFNKHFTE